MKLLAKTILLLEAVFFVFALFNRLSLFPEKRILNFTGEKKITIDDSGLERQVSTQAENVGAVLAEKNIQLGEIDEVIPGKNTEIFPGMIIFINRPAKVAIQADGKTQEKYTFSKTVSDVLVENNVTLSHLDTIEPPEQTRPRNNLKIVVTRIKTEEITTEESIDFRELEQKDSQVDWGEEKITQAGEKGVKETTYKINYENGEEVSRIKLTSKITRPPVSQIVKIGTRIRVGKAESGIASWYNAGLQECASRDFPPGTWLRVTNRTSGKQVFVKVAGYGPLEGTGKLIDLDNKAFKELAPLGQGTAKVKVEEILNKGFKP